MTSHGKLAAAAAVLAAGAGAVATLTDECQTAEVHCPAAQWAAMGHPEITDYGVMTSCVAPVASDLHKDCSVLAGTERTEVRFAQPAASVWGRSHHDAPYQCACSTGSQCEVMGPEGWVAAVKGSTLGAGTWRGAGCVLKQCVVLSGLDPGMPEACR